MGIRSWGALREQSGGRVDLKAGTLYPILHKLEKQKSVRSWWDDSTGRDRKWYALTQKGKGRLECDAREWLDYSACVRDMLGRVLGDKTQARKPALKTEN